MKQMISMIAFGTVFGFVLSRSGATQYDLIQGMFLLQDFHLMGVIGLAILVAGLGMAIFKKAGTKSFSGETLDIKPKPRTAGNLWGGLLFGAGWALTGTCPGTALSQLGEGTLTALFTISGIVLGTMLYKKVGARAMAFLEKSKDPSVNGSAAKSS